MKYYLIAGEASGDLHGSNLMKELKKEDTSAEFRFFGGDLMQQVGGDLVKHYREMAFMGIVNVVLNLKTIGRNMELCKKDILNFNPDVVILIDYPGFNLRIAEFAKQNNFRVFYYISPKLWAWKEYRAKKIKAFVDEMFTILPFETEFFKKHNIDVHYVGNPLLDSISEFKQNAKLKQVFLAENDLDDRPIVALLAGSRVQEIKRMLPVMVKVAGDFPDFQFVVAGVNSIEKQLYRNSISGSSVKIIFNQTYDLLSHSHTALVTSGTAALETAMLNVPQAVLYRIEGGWVLDKVMRKFVLKTKMFSLPNIIMNREIIKELIQIYMTYENVKAETEKLLFDENYRKRIFDDYKRLMKLMGEPGSSKRAATKMISLLK